MREVNKIVVHCSATQEGKNISAATIDKWHKKEDGEESVIIMSLD